jgi:ATP-dependent Clp protease ATP-binding subunit ClpA
VTRFRSPAALEEARALEDDYVGTEHFLFSVAAGDSRAAAALRQCGITHERLIEGHLERRALWEEEHPRTGRRPQLNPAAYRLMGRMEGFAAAAGSQTIEPEHVLLALVWDADSTHGRLLRDLGTTRADVQRALGRLGIAVPPLDPAADDDRPWGERIFVPVESLDRLIAELTRRIPKGSLFGFNYSHDHTQAWVKAGAEIDLQAMVDEVLAESIDRRP